MHRRAIVSLSALLVVFAITAQPAFASSGTITAPSQYAWNDNGGYVNWSATGGNVSVTDSALTGYIWSAGFGWINLSPTNGGVTNSAGVLGGYAWSANTGWINFTGVTIDSNGVFHGHTVAQSTFGTMTFDCAYCNVTTTWRVAVGSSAPPQTTAGGNGPPLSGTLSFGYQTSAGTTASSSAATHPVGASTPASLVPTSPPPKSEPSTKPPTSRTSPPSSPMTLTATVQPTPTATTAQAPPSPDPTAAQPASGQPLVSSVSTSFAVSTCSWFTCWLQGLWEFISSFVK